MSVKISKCLLMVFVMLGISGCAEKVYVDNPIEVKVPVKCVVPEVKCFPGQATYTEEIAEMRMCIERYKQAVEVCK